jgi:hypothetical protein
MIDHATLDALYAHLHRRVQEVYAALHTTSDEVTLTMSARRLRFYQWAIANQMLDEITAFKRRHPEGSPACATPAPMDDTPTLGGPHVTPATAAGLSEHPSAPAHAETSPAGRAGGR